MQTILILNPNSGMSDLAVQQHTTEDTEELILAGLRTHNIEPEVWYTSAEDPGTELARKAVQQGAETVIAAGGDGTLHAVASGLIGTGCTLGILPMGTMNNVARSLEIPEDIAEACAIIAHGHTSLIDIGRMNDHVFLEVTGVGLEAALFPAAEEVKSKGIQSTIRGVIKGLSTLWTFKPTRFAVSFDGKRKRRFRAIQISVCNSPFYGARLQFAPYAVMDDGILDVLIYKNFSKSEYIRHAISISQGKRILEPRLRHLRVRSIHIEAEHPVEVHVDGEPKGFTPANITIQPGVLRVRVPEKVAKSPRITSKHNKQLFRKQLNDYTLEERRKGPLHV